MRRPSQYLRDGTDLGCPDIRASKPACVARSRRRAALAKFLPFRGDSSARGRGAVALLLAAAASFAAASPALGQTPTVTIKAGPAAVEGGSAMFTFEASGLTGAIRVGFELSHERAYTGLFTRRISLSDQNGSSSARPVPLIKNGLDEPDGWMKLKVLPGDGYVVGSPNSATVLVADADPTTVALSAPAGDIAEGDDKTLSVSLGRALLAGEDLTVALTFGGSAAFGADYSLSAPDPAPKGVSYVNLSSDDLANKPPSIVFTGGDNIASEAGVILEGLTDNLKEATETVTVDLGTLTASAGLGGGAKAEAGGASFSIDDATNIKVGVEPKTSPVTEGATATFTLTADPAPLVDTTVKVQVSQSGEYVATDDLGSKEVVIKAGAATAELSAATDGDSTDEPPGGAIAVIQAGDGYVVASANAATVKVQDDDPTTVTLEVTGSEALEGSGLDVGRFRVTLGRPLTLGESLGVPLLFSGGTPGTDFSLKLVNRADHGNPVFDAAARTVTFRATDHSKSAAELVLQARVDAGDKDDVIVVDIPKASTGPPGTPVLGATGLQGGASGSRTGDGEITLLDAERTYRISGGDAVDEGGIASFTVHANRNLVSNTLVVVNITQKGDFLETRSRGGKTITIPKGAASKALTVQTVGDDKDEPDGQVIATIIKQRGYKVAAPPNHRATVTVNDDDDPPPGNSVVKFAAASATAAETEGSTTIDINLSPAPTAELTLKYALSGTAAQGADYAIAGASDGAGTLTVPKDSATASITVAITDDALGEADETVILSLADSTGYSVDKPGSFTLTIADDEPALAIAAAADTVAEGTAATFTVSAKQPVATDVAVGVALTGNGDFFGEDALGAKEVMIAKGKKTASLSVPTANDDKDEPNGWVRATLEDRAAYTIPTSPDDSAQIVVADNDDPMPVISVNGGAAVTEGESASFTISAQPAPQTTVTVKFNVGQTGDFIPEEDMGEMTVEIGSSGTVSYLCPTVNDESDEPNGQVRATIVQGEGYEPAEPPGNVANVPVNDNDEPLPVISISGGAGVAEGNSASFTLTASPAPAANLAVSVGVAQNGDFAAQGETGSRTVAVGTSGTARFDVATTDDDEAETNGTIQATVEQGTSYVVADPPANSAIVAVNDNDAQVTTPEVTLSATPNPVLEGESVTVTASLSQSLGNAVTIPLAFTLDTAEADDIGALASITIAANQTSGTGTIAMSEDSDTDDETVAISLGALPGDVLPGTPSTVNLHITDDDTPTRVQMPEITLSASPNPVNEGDPISITVSISQALPSAVIIPLVLTPDTAEPDDIGELASITIAANQSNATETIATNKDDDADDETFAITLGALPDNVLSGTPSTVNLRIMDAETVMPVETVGEEVPATFALEQNYPNPFNPSTMIEFTLDRVQHVTLSVYDMLGQEVQVLMDGVQPADRYRVTFDASELASGTYLYVLRAEEQIAAKTMALLK